MARGSHDTTSETPTPPILHLWGPSEPSSSPLFCCHFTTGCSSFRDDHSVGPCTFWIRQSYKSEVCNPPLRFASTVEPTTQSPTTAWLRPRAPFLRMAHLFGSLCVVPRGLRSHLPWFRVAWSFEVGTLTTRDLRAISQWAVVLESRLSWS